MPNFPRPMSEPDSRDISSHLELIHEATSKYFDMNKLETWDKNLSADHLEEVGEAPETKHQKFYMPDDMV